MGIFILIDKDILDEAKTSACAGTKNGKVDKALKGFIRRWKALKLFNLEGKVQMSYSVGI